MLKGNLRVDYTPVHKAVREAMINMVTNADFHGRRGVVVNKDAEGFKFANPGTMRVSLKDAIQGNSSDPRNGTMLKMLAMVEYGERAGSGLHRIFHAWETVYHCKPTMETTASGGVDRTILRLSFEGHQPDIQAMRLLYDDPNSIEILDVTPESTPENGSSTKKSTTGIQSKGEISSKSKGESTAETLSKGESNGENIQENQSKGKNNGEKVISLLKSNGELTLPEVARILNLSLGGIEKIVRQLKRDGILVREGSTKAGRWIVKD